MRTRLLTLVAATVVLGMSAPAITQAAQAVPPSGSPRGRASHHPRPQAAKPRRPVLFGLDDHWESDIVSDDKQLHAKSGIVGTFLAWSRTDMDVAKESRMVIQYAEWAHGRGAIPMIDLHPPAGVTDASIAAGSQDKTLAVYAKALRQWNHPFLLRLFPEMNGSWQEYSPGYDGNTTADFIAAWRHVVTLFRNYHATNVQFIWNPDRYFPTEKVSFPHLWPGNGYVDWVGIDIYDYNGKPDGHPSARAAAVTSVKTIRKFTSKPLIVPELGVADYSHKPRWISNSLQGLASLGVQAVVWFNENGKENWRLDSTSASLQSARKTLAGPSARWPGHNGGDITKDQDLISRGSW